MKVRSTIKCICPHCYMVRRGKRRFVYCKETPKHKQRQGFHTIVTPEVSAAPTFPVINYNFCQLSNIQSSVSKFTVPTIATSASSKLSPATKYIPQLGFYTFVAPVNH